MKKYKGIIVAFLIIGASACSNHSVPENRNIAINTGFVKMGESREKFLDAQCNGIDIYPYPKEAYDNFDKGLRKWVIVFNNFTQLQSPTCEIKRLTSSIQPNKGNFAIFETNFSIPTTSLELSEVISNVWCHVDYQKNCHVLFSGRPTIVFSEKGFFPGEKITIRARAEGFTQYDTITFCPVPLVLRDSSGNELMHAELANIIPTCIANIGYINRNNFRFIQFWA